MVEKAAEEEAEPFLNLDAPDTGGRGGADEVRPLLAVGAGGPGAGADDESAVVLSQGADSEDWDYVVVFDRVTPSEEHMKDPGAVMRDIFKDRVLEPWADVEPAFWDKIAEGKISKADFASAVWAKVTDIMSGPSCGFELGWKESFDDEHVLLLIRLRSKDTVEQLAQRLKLSVPVTHIAYAVRGMSCPRVAPSLRHRLGLTKTPATFAPIHLRFERKRQQAFAEAGQKRIRAATAMLDEILGDPALGTAMAKERLRRILRLEDICVSVLVTLVERIRLAGQSNSAQELGKLKELFTRMNEALEAKDRDLQDSMKGLAGDQARFEHRMARWTHPHFPSFEEFQTAHLYQGFGKLNLLRLIRQRIQMFMNLTSMEKHGIISAFFPLHDKNALGHFSESWSSLRPRHLFQWPGGQYNEAVRNYFGEEVAFFFNWLNFETRMLLIPAFLGVLALIGTTFLFPDSDAPRLKLMFSVTMCLWVACLSGLYNQEATTRNILWGMRGYEHKGMQRADYKPEMRGSLAEAAVRVFHWLLVLAILAESVWSAYVINKFRRDVRLGQQHPGDRARLPFGIAISYPMAQQIGLYAITANIKLMSLVWAFLSPRIALRENWRTDQVLKDRKVAKSFLVQMVVNYYPFFYLAFIRDFVEGCIEDRCITELKQNLVVFFVVHIATVVGSVLLQMATTWWRERRAAKKATDAGKQVDLSTIEDEAMRPPYPGDTEDYMRLSISLGFISMFSVLCPFLALLAFVTNIVESRVLAYRMVRVVRRPVPRGQEGIGTWLTVMQLIAHVSGVVSVALCIFSLPPIKDCTLPTKLWGFIAAEHTMLALIEGMRQCLPPSSPSDAVILESSDEAEAKMLAADLDEVFATSGAMACLEAGEEARASGGRVPVWR